MKFLFDVFEGMPRSLTLSISVAMTALAGFIDLVIGPDVSSAIFYAVPIGVASWYGSRGMGMMISTLAAIVWLLTDNMSGREYSHQAIVYWNATVRFGLFSLIAYLISGFSTRLKLEAEMADIDSLTGALNSRAFYEQAEKEILRMQRFKHPFTVAYFDLDDFKQVNDQFGHTIGDELLQTVVSTIMNLIRKTDFMARLGGDEFAVFLVETGSDTAKKALAKIRQSVLQKMTETGWPVTLSIGMVSYETAPANVKEMIKLADSVMYSVKRKGKDGFRHMRWDGKLDGI
ncbi:MAG: diguanylate cyclase [Deltaproteobacteria bacterium]|nr:MAG: diguanylate cyclase [Deltaproteobacteria bacterium]